MGGVQPPIDDATVHALRPHVSRRDRDAAPALLDVGFSNIVIRFGGSVVRVARNDDAAAGHRRETLVLNSVSGRLPVAVPWPVRLVPPSAAVPYGASVHPFLPGDVMTARASTTLARGIAAFLASLHAITPSTFLRGTLPHMQPVDELRRIEGELGCWLRLRIDERYRARLSTSLARSERILDGSRLVVCHGDAWFGNMLVVGNDLASVLDWEDACVGDPALDLAAQLDLEGSASDDVIATYAERRDPGPRLRERLAGHELLRHLAGLAYVVRNDIEEEFDDGLAKVIAVLDREA
jgi:aminoglycoside phosphotransferase (APT) family kinase protein